MCIATLKPHSAKLALWFDSLVHHEGEPLVARRLGNPLAEKHVLLEVGVDHEAQVELTVLQVRLILEEQRQQIAYRRVGVSHQPYRFKT